MSWRVKGKKCQKPLIFFRLRKSRYFFFLLFLENCRLTSLYTLYLLTTTTRSTKVKISWPTCQKISFSSYLWDFSSLLVIYLRKNAEKTHKWVKILPNDIKNKIVTYFLIRWFKEKKKKLLCIAGFYK